MSPSEQDRERARALLGIVAFAVSSEPRKEVIERIAEALAAERERALEEALGHKLGAIIDKQAAEARAQRIAALADAAVLRSEDAENKLAEARNEAIEAGAHAIRAEIEIDELRAALRRLLEVIDHAESKVPHSPWCNGNHEGTSCEGDYLTMSAVDAARALLAAGQPAEGEPK